MQLSAKALLKPFSAPPKDMDDSRNDDEDLEGGLASENSFEDQEDVGNDGNDGDANRDGDEADDEAADDDRDEEEDPLVVLDEEERKKLLEDTLIVRTTLNKVYKFLVSCHFTQFYSFKIRKLSFAIINSTTIALPAWRKACTNHKLPLNLIPRDVKTRWNSTYDMVKMAFAFRAAIDDITADKSLKLRKYELDDDDWKVIGDLLRVLKVRFLFIISRVLF